MSLRQEETPEVPPQAGRCAPSAAEPRYVPIPGRRTITKNTVRVPGDAPIVEALVMSLQATAKAATFHARTVTGVSTTTIVTAFAVAATEPACVIGVAARDTSKRKKIPI